MILNNDPGGKSSEVIMIYLKISSLIKWMWCKDRSAPTSLINQLRYYATICLKYCENTHWLPGCDPNILNIKQVCKPPVLCFCTNC